LEYRTPRPLLTFRPGRFLFKKGFEMLAGFRAWFADPLHGADGNTSVVDVFLLVGLVIIAAVIWRLTLNHLLAD